MSDYVAVHQVMVEAFGPPGAPEPTARTVARMRRNPDPRERPDLTLAAFDGSRGVGHVGVIEYAMHVGRSTVPVVGLAGVSVRVTHRRIGLASVMVRRALDAGRAAGLPVGFLFGIPDFYHRFGFVSAYSPVCVRVETKVLPARGEPGWTQRLMRPDQGRAILREYEPLYRDVVGTSARATLRWRGDSRHVWLSGPRRAGAGYVIGHDNARRATYEVFEAGGHGHSFWRAVLPWARHEAQRAKRDRVEFCVPLCHPLVTALREVDHAIERTVRINGGPMVAILDLPSAFQHLRAELAARWAAAGRGLSANRLTLSLDGQAIAIERRGRTVHIDPAPRGPVDLKANLHLGRLFMGYGEPLETLERFSMPCRPAARPLVAALFPARDPFLSPPDHF